MTITFVQFVAVYGTCSIVAAAIAWVVAAVKRRDYHYWVPLTFFLPPALLFLVLLPKNIETPKRDHRPKEF